MRSMTFLISRSTLRNHLARGGELLVITFFFHPQKPAETRQVQMTGGVNNVEVGHGENPGQP
jgi:hypothetical protein